MAILRAIVTGTHDPTELARLRDIRCKASVETVEAALTGNYQSQDLFALRQALELYDTYQAKIAECDDEIETALARLDPVQEVSSDALRKLVHRTRQSNEPRFDVRSALFGVLGIDLTQVHGFGPHTALRMVGECGTDMSRWPTAKRFTSWLNLWPGNKISGGKVLSSKSRRSPTVPPRSCVSPL